MSRASIPQMSPHSQNPRLNTSMDALVSKLTKMAFLQPQHFRYYLVTTLIDRWFRSSPRELFQVLMYTEYAWRLSLRVGMEEENEAMVLLATSAGGPDEVDPLKGEDHSEEIADQYYHRGWEEGRNALREEALGDEAKRAIQEIIIQHRLKKTSTGRLACACNRGSDSPVDWATHVSLRIKNYLRNEFISQTEAAKSGD